MTVETNANFISDFNKAYPRNRDLIKEGDDHIRLIKSVMQNTFPGMDGALTAGTDKLNKLDAAFTFEESTLKINNDVEFKKDSEVECNGTVFKNAGEPEDEGDLVTLKYLQGSAMWPIGSIFMTVDSRNPKEILGFGTWEKFAAGRVIVGTGTTTDASNETRTVANEAKGGNYAVKLTEKNTPKHAHGSGTLAVSDSGDHEHTVDLRVHSYAIVNGNEWVVPHGDIAGESSRFQNTQGAKTTKGSGAHGHTVSGSTESFGSGEGFDIVPPFMACNIWVRKADAVSKE
ncbi:MAG: phage baseplate protein [Bacteroidales bacterium]